MFEVDAFGGAVAQRRRGAVERREHEVAGVEEAGGAAAHPVGAAFERGAGRDDADRGAAQARLQRVGAPVAFAEALAQRFGAAGQAGDAGGEHGGAGGQPGEAVADRGDSLLQPPGFGREPAVGGDEALGPVGELPGERAEPLQFVDSR